MEIIKSPSLLAAVRAEVAAAYETSPETGKKTINTRILLTLPLIQSIYAEILRLHVSMLVTRQVVANPIEIGGFTLEKGAMLQATTDIDHYNENVWASEGHPASEFWAERHIKVVDGKQEFALAGNTYDFFPYGEFRIIFFSGVCFP
jgi:cytochrome P450